MMVPVPRRFRHFTLIAIPILARTLYARLRPRDLKIRANARLDIYTEQPSFIEEEQLLSQWEVGGVRVAPKLYFSPLQFPRSTVPPRLSKILLPRPPVFRTCS